IKSTIEGQNDWKIIYSAEAAATKFRHFNSIVANDKLYVYLMEDVAEDARPLHLQVFSLSGGTVTSTKEEKLLEEIVVYPNPNKGIFEIKSGNKMLNYSISSIEGKILQTGVLTSNQLNISHFLRGIYFLELFADDRKVVKKIVME
ncbi:MAG: T9SS type A sorting domain-containing protein, partial [Saprospiraceae bacterium]